MSYSLKYSCTKIWTPGSIDDIRTYFNVDPAYTATQEFNFKNGDIESSAFYIEKSTTDTTYPRTRVYCSLFRSNATNDFACCGYLSYDTSTTASPQLLMKRKNNLGVGFYTIKEKYNKTTNSYEKYDELWTSDVSTSFTIKDNTTAYVNINCPFFPIFETEALADSYIATPDDNTIYSQALNYYAADSGRTYTTNRYLYQTLPTLMPSFLEAAKEKGYSSGEFIDNVLSPINDLIRQFKSINYTNKINEIKEKRANITKEFTHFNSMELIMEVPATRGQIPFPAEAPLKTKLDYTIFSLEELQEMISFVEARYPNDIKDIKPIILTYVGNATESDEFYHRIRAIHPAIINEVSNIKIINAAGEEQDVKYYFETYDKPDDDLRLYSSDNGNFKHAEFRFYPNRTGAHKCANWYPLQFNAGDPLKHNDQITLNAININIPFYCSHDVYVRYGNENLLCLKKERDVQGNNRDDSLDSDPTFAGMVHIKPIVTLFNRYEMSNINGWDGNKLKVGDGYLLAPQVGAGIKDHGMFTGVIMGVKQIKPNKTENQRIGLFGFHQGIQSFFLNSEDGSAIFGKPGTGQIVIDPKTDKGMLYSSTYWKEYNAKDGKPINYNNNNKAGAGMLIDFTTPEIRFGNGNFVVDQYGNTSIAGGGGLAGWKITDTTIQSNVSEENGRLVLDSGATLLGQDKEGNKSYSYSYSKIYSGKHKTLGDSNTGFYLSKEGLSVVNGNNSKLYISTSGNPEIYSGGHNKVTNNTADGFYLGQAGLSIRSSYPKENSDGTIDTLHSSITIRTDQSPVFYADDHSRLISTSKGFYLGADGLSIGDSIRIIASEGGEVLIGRVNGSKHWTINGDANNSYIGYNANAFSCSNLDNASTYSIGGNTNSVYMGTNGIRLGKKFAVDDQGNLVAEHLIAKVGGNIGGWTIGDHTLKSSNNTIIIDSSGYGSITGPNFYLTGNTNPNSPLSQIAGWYINQENLTSTLGNYRTTIGSGGTLFGAYSEDNFATWTTKWSIDKDGNAYFANFSGNIPVNKSLTVAGTISAGGGAAVLDSNGITATGCNITGGSIGGFTISENQIGTTGATYLTSNIVGAVSGKFNNLYVNNVQMTTIAMITGINLERDETTGYLTGLTVTHGANCLGYWNES